MTLPHYRSREEVSTVFGMRIFVDQALPLEVTPAEQAKRIVRRGMADITLHGKPLVNPGPEPLAETHAIVHLDEMSGVTESISVSPAMRHRLITFQDRWDADQPEASDPIKQIWNGRDWAYKSCADAIVRLVPEDPKASMLQWAAKVLEKATAKRYAAKAGWTRVGYLEEAGIDFKLTPWQSEYLARAYSIPQVHWAGILDNVNPA